MAKKTAPLKLTGREKVRIQLDGKKDNVIEVSKAALDYWKKQYPNAKIIGEVDEEPLKP